MTVNWTTTYEGQPSDGDAAISIDNAIRSLKTAVSERFEVEHELDDGRHVYGSAKIYEQSDAPTEAPDGETLGTDDQGRLWSDGELMRYWDGSEWRPLYAGVSSGTESLTALVEDDVYGWCSAGLEVGERRNHHVVVSYLLGTTVHAWEFYAVYRQSADTIVLDGWHNVFFDSGSVNTPQMEQAQWECTEGNTTVLASVSPSGTEVKWMVGRTG